jgi:hypothetical protein
MKQEIKITVLDNGYVVVMKNYFYADVKDQYIIINSKKELMEQLKELIFESGY